MQVGGQASHHGEHLADQLRIERRGRLVEEHHLGVHGKSTGDRDALLLPAGELNRVLVGLFGKPHQLEELACGRGGVAN